MTGEHHHSQVAQPIPKDRQAFCPVTGDAIDILEAEKLGHFRDYNGKRVYLCRAICIQLFDKHPEKYIDHHDTAIRLTLAEKENLVDNIWAFRFKPSLPLTWIPGQFIRVELDHDTPDDVIWQDSDKPLVFVAGGIGVTPFRSILKQRVHDNQPLKATLIYSGRDEKLPFKDEFDAWAHEHPELTVKYIIGQRLTAEKIAELYPTINESLVYISGSEPMVETLGRQLKTLACQTVNCSKISSQTTMNQIIKLK